jgi:hypothetical protein
VCTFANGSVVRVVARVSVRRLLELGDCFHRVAIRTLAIVDNLCLGYPR